MSTDLSIGTGYKARCVKRIRDRVQLSGKKSPFHIMLNEIEKAAAVHIDTCVKRLWIGIDETFTKLATDFDSMTSRTGYDISELPLRDRLREHLATAVPEFEKQRRLFDQVKRDHDVEVKAWKD